MAENNEAGHAVRYQTDLPDDRLYGVIACNTVQARDSVSSSNPAPRDAAGIVRDKPGGLGEMHWHPNVSQSQYWIQGSGCMTVFNAEENAPHGRLRRQRRGCRAGDGGTLHREHRHSRAHISCDVRGTGISRGVSEQLASLTASAGSGCTHWPFI